MVYDSSVQRRLQAYRQASMLGQELLGEMDLVHDVFRHSLADIRFPKIAKRLRGRRIEPSAGRGPRHCCHRHLSDSTKLARWIISRSIYACYLSIMQGTSRLLLSTVTTWRDQHV